MLDTVHDPGEAEAVAEDQQGYLLRLPAPYKCSPETMATSFPS